MTQRKKFDTFILGFGVCFILPFVIFAFTWEAVSKSDFSEVAIWLHQPVFLNYVIMCQLPSSLVLFWGYKTERWKVCKGGILGIVPYLMLLIYLFV